MSEQEKQLRLEATVHSRPFDPDGVEKQFLGATIECSDGKEWVIDYDEQSPFHAFAGRQVLVCGEPYNPEGQAILGDHLRVSTMRVVEVTPDADLIEVGAEQALRGHFERVTRDVGGSALSFITDTGDTFLVANHPAGANVGRTVDVRAHHVEPSLSSSAEKYLWVIRAGSAADLRDWRA